MRYLGHDRAETAMSQTLLETGEQGLLIARLDMDQSIRGKSCLRQRGGEQIGARDTPEDFASRSRCYSCREKPGRSAIDSPISAAGNFMQTPDR